MRRKFLQLLGIFLLSFCLAGCWDLREAEETGIVVGMGIDQKEDGTIIVIAQTVKPQIPGAGGGVTGSKQGVDTFQNWYSIGETVYDAVLNFTLKSPNVFFWSHNQVFIISEKLAQKGLADVLDFIERDPEFKQNAWILIARGDLPEIMEASNNAGQPPSQVLADIINIRNRNAKYAISSLGDFLQQIGSPTTQPYTAGVTFARSLMKDPDSVFLPGQEPTPAKELTLSDTAVFNRDKLVGWFNPVESRGLLWVQGKIEQGLLILNLEKQKISVEITRGSSKLKTEVREGHLVMKVEVKVQGNLTEMTPGIELDEKQVKKIESLMAKTVGEEIHQGITRAQELNTDVLGFAGAVHRDYPQAWNEELAKQWPEIFKELEVEVAVESQIHGVGLITNSVNPQKIK
ncbi:Ger(x)C family spore germination protein [Desulforamulus ruminis]|uniref:Ger(x)C family spore germination protein n=1 Tax=Desulforamulus ruminis TaxID=1564 RepID=UPI002FD9C9ED